MLGLLRQTLVAYNLSYFRMFLLLAQHKKKIDFEWLEIN